MSPTSQCLESKRSLPTLAHSSLSCNSLWQFVVFSCEIEVRSFLRQLNRSLSIKPDGSFTRWRTSLVVLRWVHPVLFPSDSLISSSDTSFHYLQWGITSSHCGGSRWGTKQISSFPLAVFKSCDLMGPKNKHIKLPVCRQRSVSDMQSNPSL